MTYKNKYRYIKRAFDLIFGTILLILSSPVMITASILIKIEDPEGSVFFRQDRGGINNSLLKIYKFRTMINLREKNGKKLTDQDRMLKTGKIIRKFSIDELPQIFNILKGEMSFIGPRPLSFKFIPYYTKDEIRRHDVLPGISGWAQVNGRNYLSWEDKFKLDLYYVKNYGPLIDIKIFYITLKQIFFKPDVGVLGKDVKFKPIHIARQPRTNEYNH